MDLEIDSFKIIHRFYSLQVLCVPWGVEGHYTAQD